jgi:MFS family permease
LSTSPPGASAQSIVTAHAPGKADKMNTTTYKHYFLAILLVILAFTFVERLALAIAVEDIKADLGLSDTQLGFLTGIAFTFFYAVMGIPIARWADRGNRVTIISVTTALCGAAVALCGMVGNFLHLVLIRIGVAVGEAGCLPPAQSLIADLFLRAQRPRATAMYMLGIPLSGLVGYLLAGWLNEIHGWRTMFIVLGLPGLALAALVFLTLRDPRFVKTRRGERGALPFGSENSAAVPPAHGPPLVQVFRALLANTTFQHLLICFALLALFGSGVAQWMPAFFVRTYGLQTGELGTWLAAIHVLGGVLGLLAGGEFASRFAANNERLQLKLMGLAYTFFGVTSALTFVAPSQYWAFAFMSLSTIGANLATAPLFATLQTIVPAPMRATSLAILYLFSNLIGTGVGPLAVGAVSDALRPFSGEASLRYALLLVCPGYLWGAWHLWLASRSVTNDLRNVQGDADDRPHQTSTAQQI